MPNRSQVANSIIVAFFLHSSIGCDIDRSANAPSKPPATNTPANNTTAKPEERVSKAELWVFAKNFIRDRLKSPSSSSFGGVFSEYQDPDRAIIKLDENAWAATGWVDADNSFGANLRNDFYLEMQLRENTVTLTYLEFEGMEPFGKSILPELGAKLSREAKEATEERIKQTVISRQAVGTREYFLIKTNITTETRDQIVKQIAADLPNASRKSKLWAWVYNELDEYHGCIAISKTGHTFTDATSEFPDPFKPDGYFGFREWSSPSGQFKLKAKFSGLINGKVSIIDENGKQRDVDLTKLSETDQAWAKNAPNLLPR